MPIERIKVPVPGMRLFTDATGQLWLPAVTLVREGAGASTKLTVHERPPPEATEATPISDNPPRTRHNPLVRVLGAFWR